MAAARIYLQSILAQLAELQDEENLELVIEELKEVDNILDNARTALEDAS